MNDEYLDLVDEHDNVIGKELRSEIYAKKLSNYRVVNAFIRNSKGELWIPRRSANKKIFPLCLDFSMGGHVEAGESYEDAFKRETAEELTVDIDKVSTRFLGQLSPGKDSVSSFMRVYEILAETTPAFNKNDFVEYFWISPKALLDRLAQGEKTKSDLPKLITKFYL